jgi:predicted nucleotidyltransferase component of viral defense system
MAKTILTSLQRKILSLLSSDKNFQNNFYLTGGTALSEYYLYHRISEDLDFFSPKEIDTIWLTTIANQLKGDTKAKKLDIQQSFNRNLVIFSFKNEILKTEFTYFPFVQIEKPKILDAIKTDSLLDIAVNKFFTIYQNPQARHFIDLYLIIKDKQVKWQELSRLARIKFDVAIDPIQLGSQLVVASEVKDLPKMIINLPENQWREFFIEKAKELKNEIEK